MNMLDKLRRRIPDAANEELLADLLSAAADMICAYTMRASVPEKLSGAQIEIAVILFNRMGMEGESSHAEGSVSRSAESLPEYLRRQLNPWRAAKAVGA